MNNLQAMYKSAFLSLSTEEQRILNDYWRQKNRTGRKEYFDPNSEIHYYTYDNTEFFDASMSGHMDSVPKGVFIEDITEFIPLIDPDDLDKEDGAPMVRGATIEISVAIQHYKDLLF